MPPIIYIHTGTSYYQKYSLYQSHHTNSSSQIYLVSDNDMIKYPFLKNIDIAKFSKTAKAFEKVYKHLSTNLYDHELFCFQRWFVLNEISKGLRFKELLYLDSDVMLFGNIFEYLNKYKPYSFTISNKISPHICYFPDTKVLDNFCSFLQEEMYTNPFFVDKINYKQQYHQQHKEPGGVCDMTAFEYFQKFKKYTALELTEIREHTVIDNNINSPDGFMYDKKKKIKKITFENDDAYGIEIKKKQVFFKALHFQGSNAKEFMPLFYNFNDLEIEKEKDISLIRQKRNKAMINEVKTKIAHYVKKVLK